MRNNSLQVGAEFWADWKDGKPDGELARIRDLMRQMARAGLIESGDVLEMILEEEEGQSTSEVSDWVVDVLPSTACPNCSGYVLRFRPVKRGGAWQYLEGRILYFKLVRPARVMPGKVMHKGGE